MPYREVSGNIFNSNADALVNTVNCVGVMGKGIALDFRRRFPDMFQEYKRICQNGKLKPGEILPYRKEKPWILNFAIKNDWKHGSKIEWIESCLKKFMAKYKEMDIESVAFPWMGAVNGGIPLQKIKSITRFYLSELPDIDVEVYDFDPDASDSLFEKLSKISKSTYLDINDLSKKSGIQPRYVERIMRPLREESIKSLPRLIESGLLGKTNIERLYKFLIDYKIDVKNYRQLTLFDQGV